MAKFNIFVSCLFYNTYLLHLHCTIKLILPMSLRRINIPALFFMTTTLVLGFVLVFGKNFRAKESQYNSSIVMDKIVAIKELATIKYNYTGVVGYRDGLKIFSLSVPLTEKYFLLKYNAYIKAGVDFSKIKVEVFEDNKVHVSMPKARIFDIVIDENSVTVYNESENAFNPIKISDYNQALAKEKDIMREEAIRQGLLKDANRQAEMILKSFLNEMGFKNVDITLEIVIPDIH